MNRQITKLENQLAELLQKESQEQAQKPSEAPTQEQKAEQGAKKMLIKLFVEVIPLIIGCIIFNPITIENTGNGSYDFILELISFNIFCSAPVINDISQIQSYFHIKTFMFMNFFRFSLGRVEEMLKK